ARPVHIHQLELLAFEAPFLTLKVRCSKGTYIRVLGEDIGLALGCGAHLKELRRTEVGHLVLEKSITLEALAELPEEERLARLAPVDALLSTFPSVRLDEELSRRFLHGQRLALGKEAVALPSQTGRVRVYRDSDNQLLGSAHLQEFSILAPERLIATHQ
ncbi:MAG: tRNA pseudouridine(55) synthase TruB, partial [Burkholderiales bacterium]|nr:tRNA pseudouridine(55) synthase TruB [Burkholderiales bacterium]